MPVTTGINRKKHVPRKSRVYEAKWNEHSLLTSNRCTCLKLNSLPINWMVNIGQVTLHTYMLTSVTNLMLPVDPRASVLVAANNFTTDLQKTFPNCVIFWIFKHCANSLKTVLSGFIETYKIISKNQVTTTIKRYFFYFSFCFDSFFLRLKW